MFIIYMKLLYMLIPSLYILGDIVSSLIANNKKLNLDELWQFHANLE